MISCRPIRTHARVIARPAVNPKWAPSRMAEYGFYVVLLYSLVSTAWGINIPLVGAATLAALAAFCVMRLGHRAWAVYRPFAYQFACGLSCVAIALIVHGDTGGLRPFVTWLLLGTLIPALSLRAGFFHRFAIAAFLIGVSLLPYMVLSIEDANEVSRI